VRGVAFQYRLNAERRRFAEEARFVPNVHPTAIVDSRAQLADSAEIGAYSIIKGKVTIGPGTVILEHSHVHGPTMIGARCRIGPAAFVGLEPQHLRFTPDENNPTYLVIGDDVVIREGASVHRATHPGVEHATRLGDRVFAMGAVHIAHDCIIDHDAILANGALLGGHCHIGARAFLGGGCTLHQFTLIGRLAMIGGNEAVAKDVPPFGAVWERRLKGYNAVGCRRSGLTRGAIASIRSAYQLLHANRSTNAAVAAIRREVEQTPEVAEILAFIAASKRGILGARGDSPAPSADETSTA
jgi:UDP-N-acetylglucosamine acyltransferase